MEKKQRKQDVLKTKYYKLHTVTDLKDMIYKSAQRYKKRAESNNLKVKSLQ